MTQVRNRGGDRLFEFKLGWVLFQMYYVVIIGALGLLFAPLRLYLDLDKRLLPPTSPLLLPVAPRRYCIFRLACTLMMIAP